MTDNPPPAPAPEPTIEQVDALVRSRPFVGLLVISAVVGLVVSLAAWCFLEGTVQLQKLFFDHLPKDLGYDAGPPLWYLLIVLGIGGVIVGWAIARLPGNGGHIPVHGLSADGGPTQPADLAGILLAAVGTLAFGIVLGPEAPLIALGSGLAVLTIRASRKPVPDQAVLVVGAAGSFAAISFIFGSPVIGAVILIEAAGLGGGRQRLILLPGLLAAGLGSLISTGIGSISGLSSSDYALGALPLPKLDAPTLAQFAWAIPLAIVVALVVHLILEIGRRTERAATPRPLVVLPVVGLVIAVLAWAYGATTDESPVAVLLSGESALASLVQDGPSLAVSTVLLLILFKGIAYGLSLGSFRGGPTFPALFLGAAAGVIFADLPGLSLTPAVAICLSAATVAVLRLPLSSVVLGILLTSGGGAGVDALIIVAVVLAYVVSLLVDARRSAAAAPADPAPAPAPA